MTKNLASDKTPIYLGFTIVFSLWGFMFQYTKYGNNALVYISLVIILITTGLSLLNFKKNIYRNSIAIIWAPYFIYTIGGLLILGDFELIIYWLFSYIFLLLSQESKTIINIPYKVFYLSGIICIIGVLIQLLLSDFYNTSILPIFNDSLQISNWAKWNYGYAGFTCQLGLTATILVYFEAYVLYINKNKALFVISIIAIFMTGKRMMSLLALIVPIFVYILVEKNISRKNRNISLLAIGIIFITILIYYNINTLKDNMILGRLANTIIEYQQGEDISTNRTSLHELAIEAFRDSPLLGIGIRKFAPYTGAYTDAHSAYYQVLCEQGLVGIVLFIFPIVVSFIKTIVIIKKRNSDEHIGQLSFSLFIQLFIIGYSFTGNTFIDRHCFIIYFIAVGIVNCVFCKQQENGECDEKNRRINLSSCN